nr:MAG TPA_asm: hypothetical protein [Caudoviricetes sp.]
MSSSNFELFHIVWTYLIRDGNLTLDVIKCE